MKVLARLASLVLAAMPALVAAQAPGSGAEPGQPGTMPPPPAYPPPGAYPPPAAGSPSRTYATVKLGIVTPQHSDLDGMDSGWAIEGAVGYKVNPNFALEFSVGRWEMSGSQSTYDPTLGPVDVKLTFVGYPVLLTAKGILPLDKIQLYAAAGAGVHFITATGDVSASALGLSASTSDSSTPFAVHVGGGFDVHVTPTVLLGGELRYVIGELSAFGTTGHFDNLVIAGGLTVQL
jgi:opacity protein-like surface antigen